MYTVDVQLSSELSHCSLANVVPFIWWYRKVADWSAKVALASLVKGNKLFGVGTLPDYERVAGYVPLTYIL